MGGWVASWHRGGGGPCCCVGGCTPPPLPALRRYGRRGATGTPHTSVLERSWSTMAFLYVECRFSLASATSNGVKSLESQAVWGDAPASSSSCAEAEREPHHRRHRGARERICAAGEGASEPPEGEGVGLLGKRLGCQSLCKRVAQESGRKMGSFKKNDP